MLFCKIAADAFALHSRIVYNNLSRCTAIPIYIYILLESLV